MKEISQALVKAQKEFAPALKMTPEVSSPTTVTPAVVTGLRVGLTHPIIAMKMPVTFLMSAFFYE